MSNFTESDEAITYARSRWEEGEMRLQRVDPESHKRSVLEDVVDSIQVELERRIGQVFSTAEMIKIQEGAEEWSLRIAHEVAPNSPWAWEMDTVQNAAFYRYSRRASDYMVPLD